MSLPVKYILLWMSVPLLILGCSSTAPSTDTDQTVAVTFFEEEVVTSEQGNISVVLQQRRELADRSTADKAGNSLLTPQRLVNVGYYFDNYSAGSGSEIVMSIFNREGTKGADIWVYRSGKTRLTSTDQYHMDPSFSMDSKSVYFVSNRGRAMENRYDQPSYVWRMSSAGARGITRIGSPAYRQSVPTESPDSRHLLFESREFYDSLPIIWYMRMNGALETQLTRGEYPRWIDSERIVFQAVDEETGLYSIWTVNLDGSLLTQLISDNEQHCVHPAPSTDGRYLAYVKHDFGKPETSDIYIYDMRQGLSQQLTTNRSRDDLPNWSKDGQFLYFRSTRGGGWSVWRLPTSVLSE